jgi:hypothetical protein
MYYDVTTSDTYYDLDLLKRLKRLGGLATDAPESLALNVICSVYAYPVRVLSA